MTPRLRRRLLWGAALVVAVGLLVLGDEALARIGGGQSYGRGRGSSGGGGGGIGGGSGGGGGGAEIDLLFLLLRLCIEYPALGIPLTFALIVFVGIRGFASNIGGRSVHRTHAGSASSPAPRRRGPAAVFGLEALRGADPAFSVPVLQDFLILVHRRAHEALARGAFEPLAPYVAESGRQELAAANPGVTGFSELVVGSVKLVRVERHSPHRVLRVAFESTRLEQLGKDEERRVLVQEEWRFRRAEDALSLPPEDILRLGCPSCGASIETTNLGACPQCATPITAGQLQWQLIGVRLDSRRRVEPPEIGLWAGGDEGSVHVPSILAPDLSASLRSLTARHPDFDLNGFQGRVRDVYLHLQRSWSAGRWSDIRPYVTDPMFQHLRFWIEGYQRHGLRNQLADVELSRQEIVRVEVDAWYEAITVRIWGSMKDSVVDGSGEVVGGNADTSRRFSEYWTFLRAAGTGAASPDPGRCPSCGAPLDNVSHTGICGYCHSKITTGRFDWVLSRIDQPEAYG